MTSTCEQDFCACGCGRVIRPTDNHPWFKGAQCQALWQETSRLPEDKRAQFSWDQRFYHELWVHAPWSRAYWCGPLMDSSVISSANGILSSYHYAQLDQDGADSLADAMRILLHYTRAWPLADEILEPPVPKWARQRPFQRTWDDLVRENLAGTRQAVQEASVGPI